MIEELLNRGFVIDQLRRLTQDLEKGGELESSAAYGSEEPLEPASLKETLEELKAAETRESESSSGQDDGDVPPPQPKGRRRAEFLPPLDDLVFISHDPVISLVQSALEEYVTEHQPKLLQRATPKGGRRGADDFVAVTDTSLAGVEVRDDHHSNRRLTGPFEPLDPRWANTLIAMGIRKKKGKHAFNRDPATPPPIANRARLLLVGDWGTGLKRAQAVAHEMRKSIDDGLAEHREVHVIHLGDVYYSGWKREYERRFLPYWPVKPNEKTEIGSWSLNGNHDMYSGGDGYFDYLLQEPRFSRQEGSSYFSLENDYWQILGLDSAWEDHDLCDPQPQFVRDLTAGSDRATILLTHHQPFSTYGDDGPKLRQKLHEPLADGAIHAWFWGHEHRCVFYEGWEGLTFGRCIGHGGVPVYMTHHEDDPYPPAHEPKPAPAFFEYRMAVQEFLEPKPWAIFGFAVLDFDEERLKVHYINEFGNPCCPPEDLGRT